MDLSLKSTLKILNRVQLIKTFEDEKVGEAEIKKRIKNISSQNALRVWEDVEKESKKLSQTGESDWEWIPVNDTAWDESTEYGCMTGREWPGSEDSNNSHINSSSLLLVLLTIIFNI